MVSQPVSPPFVESWLVGRGCLVIESPASKEDLFVMTIITVDYYDWPVLNVEALFNLHQFICKYIFDGIRTGIFFGVNLKYLISLDLVSFLFVRYQCGG